LEPTADADENVLSEPHRSAIAISRICATVPIEGYMETLLVKRSLFWAGLILTESTFPSGQFLSSYINESSAFMDQKSTSGMYFPWSPLASIHKFQSRGRASRRVLPDGRQVYLSF
jgi:hypothetical protein